MERDPSTIDQVQLNVRALVGEILVRHAEINRIEAIGHLIVGGELGYEQLELPYAA